MHIGEQSARETQAPAEGPRLEPVPAELPVFAIALAKPACPALSKTGTVPGMVRLAEWIEPEPLPLPWVTPGMIEELPLVDPYEFPDAGITVENLPPRQPAEAK